MATVNVDVELSEFDDDEVLNGARFIVEEFSKNPKSLSKCGIEALDRLKRALDAPAFYEYPPSTAAKVRNIDEAKAAVG